jgi:hypothetical protein
MAAALLPVGIDQVRVYRHGESSAWSRVQVTSNTKGGKSITADIDLLSRDGQFVASVEGLRIRRVNKKVFTRSRQRDGDPRLAPRGERDLLASR